jgi:hypothetical protein
VEAFINQLTAYDYLVFSLIGIITLSGISKGFSKSLLKAGTLITSAILSKVFSSQVLKMFVNKVDLHKQIYDKTHTLVQTQANSDTAYLEDIVNNVLAE